MENDVLSLLDPGAGTGVLTCSVGESISGWKTKPSRMNVVAYETDSSLADLLRRCLAYLGEWLAHCGVLLDAVVRPEHQGDL